MALELTRGNKEKKPKGGGNPKNSDAFLKLVAFFEKNPFLKILIPVLLFLILAGVFIGMVFGDGVLQGDDSEVPAGATQPATEAVDVLPNDNGISDEELVALIERDPLSADILSGAVYEGIVTGSSGLKTALISVGGNKDQLVLTTGEAVGDSSWVLTEINSEYVLFEANGVTKKITK